MPVLCCHYIPVSNTVDKFSLTFRHNLWRFIFWKTPTLNSTFPVESPICHFLSVILWNQASISNCFRDIQRRVSRNVWLDLDTTSKRRSRSFILVPLYAVLLSGRILLSCLVEIQPYAGLVDSQISITLRLISGSMCGPRADPVATCAGQHCSSSSTS